MKAIILVGGYGTRMRPLTINFPKSVFPFVNKPMVQLQIEALAKVGVTEVIIAINYQAEIIKHQLHSLEQKYHIKITYSQEFQALGTAGPLKLAESILKADNPSGMFIVFNSDIICDYPLNELISAHKQNNKEGTIVLATVQDPSRFGVIVCNEEGRVDKFVQKPSYFISNKINAGIYLLNVSILDKIPQRFCMIQRETFPLMSSLGQLYSISLKNKFWFDIGKPSDYLLGQGQYLKYYGITTTKDNCTIIGNVLIDKSSQISQNCKIGPNVVIGSGCHIGQGVRLQNCTINSKTTIGKGTYISNAIISWKCKIGSWVRIQGLSSIAEEVQIKDQVRISQCMILSHKSINATVQKQVIL